MEAMRDAMLSKVQREEEEREREAREARDARERSAVSVAAPVAVPGAVSERDISASRGGVRHEADAKVVHGVDESDTKAWHK